MPDALEWDQGLHAAKFRRAVELATWLQGRPNGATFTRDDVEALESWSHFTDLAENNFTMEFNAVRELLRPFGLRIDTVGATYRKQQAIRLNVQERQALLMALSVADPGDPRGSEGVPFGLGVDRRDAEALLQFGDELDVITDALAERCAIEISHRGKRRTVDPFGLGFRNGRWYLVGRDHKRDRIRVFGLGRSGPDAPPPALVGSSGSFEPPEDIDVPSVLEVALDPARWAGNDALTAHVRVDGGARRLAARLFGPLAELETGRRSSRDSGPTVLESRDVAVDHLTIDQLVNAMMALRTHAVITDPPHAVGAVCAHLEAIVAADTGSSTSRDSSLESRPAPAPTTTPTVKAGGALTSARRIRIIATTLALAEAKDADIHIEQVGRLTNATPDQVRQALLQYEFASYETPNDESIGDNGLHVHDDGRVTVTDPWLLNEWQPTLPQALRLYVAATMAIALTSGADDADAGINTSSSTDRLSLARQKLARYLAHALGLHGNDAAKALRQMVEIAAPGTPEMVTRLKSIIDSGRTVEIRYPSPHDTIGMVEAEVDPVSLRLVGDEWILQGHVRRERLRMPGREPQSFDAPTDPLLISVPVSVITKVSAGENAAEQFSDGFDIAITHEPIVVKLEVSQDKLWLLDPYSVQKLYAVEGRKARATVSIPNEVELRTLLMRLGPDGRVRSPKEWRGVAAGIARQMLDLHGR
jgi:predicted DNA-binding transcriptional regulator YafY